MIWGVGQFVLIWRQRGESLQILASLWRFVTNVQIDPVDGFLWNWGKLRLGLRCSYSFMMKFKVFFLKALLCKIFGKGSLKVISPQLVYILMLDLDREVMNKFYKSKYSDADEVTKVGFFCQGNVYMNKSHSSCLLNIVLISMYVFSSTLKWKGKNMYVKGKNAPVWFVVRILWILFLFYFLVT